MTFQLVDDYGPVSVTRGAVCSFCGSGLRVLYPGGRRERVVRTDLELDDHDNIYTFVSICETCCWELGAMVGMVTADRAAWLQNRVDELTAEAASRPSEALSPSALAGLADAVATALAASRDDDDDTVYATVAATADSTSDDAAYAAPVKRPPGRPRGPNYRPRGKSGEPR